MVCMHLPSEGSDLEDTFGTDGLGQELQELALSRRDSDVRETIVAAVLLSGVQDVVLGEEEGVVVLV